LLVAAVCIALAVIGVFAFPPTWDETTPAAINLQIMVPGTRRHAETEAEAYSWRNLRFKPIWSLRDFYGRDWLGRYESDPEWMYTTPGAWHRGSDPEFQLSQLPIRWRTLFAIEALTLLLGGGLLTWVVRRKRRRRTLANS